MEEFQKLATSLADIGDPITQLSFDHDLGKNIPTGMDAAKWFVDLCIDNPSIGEHLKVVMVHSANPPGAENIMSYFISARDHGILNNELKIQRV